MTKNKIPNHLKDDLKGFEEFADGLDNKKGLFNRTEENTGKEYEIQNYLEIEINRLNKLTSLFGEKIPVLTSTNQIKPLIEDQIKAIQSTKTRIINFLDSSESAFNEKIADIYDKAFFMELELEPEDLE